MLLWLAAEAARGGTGVLSWNFELSSIDDYSRSVLGVGMVGSVVFFIWAWVSVRDTKKWDFLPLSGLSLVLSLLVDAEGLFLDEGSNLAGFLFSEENFLFGGLRGLGSIKAKNGSNIAERSLLKRVGAKSLSEIDFRLGWWLAIKTGEVVA
jgi:hypothetical protein